MTKLNIFEAYEALKKGEIVRRIYNNRFYKIIDGRIMYTLNVPDFSHDVTESMNFDIGKDYEIYEDKNKKEIKHLKTLISKQMPGDAYIAACKWASSRIQQLEAENEQA